MSNTTQSVAPGVETPFFFSNGRCQLFAVLHHPAGGGTERDAFVFCHAFGEEKLWAHRVFVTYARRLAAKGHVVLRFDQMGNGDSDGLFAATNIATAREDVTAAIEELRRRTGAETINLIGLRFGASIASMVADARSDVRRLIMWAPIVDGARYMQELLRINVMTQTATYREVRQDRTELVEAMRSGLTVNVDGYEMGLEMYESASAMNIGSTPHVFPGDCLIVQLDPQAKPAPELQKLASQYPRAVVMHAQEDPFWKEIPRFYQEAANLFAVTDEWLEQPSRPATDPQADNPKAAG